MIFLAPKSSFIPATLNNPMSVLYETQYLWKKSLIIGTRRQSDSSLRISTRDHFSEAFGPN